MDGTRYGITNDLMQYTNSAVFTYDYDDDGGTGAVAYRLTSNGIPYTHYIFDAPHANNSGGNPNGTEATPRTTWPLNLKEGSIVYIAGTNTLSNSGPGSKATFSGAGTTTRPVYFTGYDRPTTNNLTGNTTWLDRREYVISGTNIIIQNIAFKNAQIETRGNLGSAASYNIMVRDVYCVGNGQTSDQNVAFGFSGFDTNYWTANAWVWRAQINSYGDWQAGSENDRSFWITGNYATNTGVLDSEAWRMGGDGARIGADQGNPKHNQNYYVGRNHFWENRENGLDIKQANGGVVSENRMHDFATSSSSGGTALAIHYDPNSVWIINNSISNCLQGIASTGVASDDTNAFFIMGNLIVDALERGMYLDRAGGKFYVAHNTIYGGTNNLRTTGTIDGIDYRNNISAGVIDVAGTGYHLYIDGDSSPTSTATNMLFYNASGGIRMLWGSTTYTAVAGFNTAAGAGSVEADPLFIDAAGDNFGLQSGSQAINGGASIADILQRFEDQWGYALEAVDLAGNPRNGTWDIGAFEYDSGAPSASAGVSASGGISASNGVTFQ